VKAMDVWMLSCISFVFGTMIELAIVCYITRLKFKRNKYYFSSDVKIQKKLKQRLLVEELQWLHLQSLLDLMHHPVSVVVYV
jgi:hypothetical protein